MITIGSFTLVACPRCKQEKQIQIMMCVDEAEYRVGNAPARRVPVKSYYVGCWACRTRTLIHSSIPESVREWNNRPYLVTSNALPSNP